MGHQLPNKTSNPLKNSDYGCILAFLHSCILAIRDERIDTRHTASYRAFLQGISGDATFTESHSLSILPRLS